MVRLHQAYIRILERKASAEENNLLNVVMQGLSDVNRLAELMRDLDIA